MRALLLKKKVLTMVVFAYAAVLAVSVTYAAITGMIEFTGTATTQADLNVQIASDSIQTIPRNNATTLWGSRVISATVEDGGTTLRVAVEMHAPSDEVAVQFSFQNRGRLPAEFQDPEITIGGITDLDAEGNPIPLYEPLLENGVPVIDSDGNPVMQRVAGEYQRVFPIEIEGAPRGAANMGRDGLIDFTAISGRTTGGLNTFLPDASEAADFVMWFIWCDQTIVATRPGEIVEFTVEFPYEIAVDLINPPPTPTPTGP